MCDSFKHLVIFVICPLLMNGEKLPLQCPELCRVIPTRVPDSVFELFGSQRVNDDDGIIPPVMFPKVLKIIPHQFYICSNEIVTNCIVASCRPQP